ncbi:MAG: hypothetical protein AB7P69_07635 [Candidatus Binatia bacterium]
MGSTYLSGLLGTLKSTFRINKATFDASGLTAARTINLPDVTGFLPIVLDRVTSTVDIVNDASEQALYSKSIAANVLSTNRLVRLSLLGDYQNESGAVRTLQIKVKLGSTTLFDDVTGNISSSSGGANARRPFCVKLIVGNKGATNSQIANGEFWLGSRVAATAGIGDLANAIGIDNDSYIAPFAGSAAEDTTSAKTFSVTVQHSATATTLSVRRLLAFLELL